MADYSKWHCHVRPGYHKVEHYVCVWRWFVDVYDGRGKHVRSHVSLDKKWAQRRARNLREDWKRRAKEVSGGRKR